MKNSITISNLKLINPEEWNDFRKFVASPFFNKGRSFEALVSVLTKYHPGFDSDELTKQFVYKKLYPGKIFKNSVINTLLSGLNQLCEEFFIYQDFRENPKRDLRLLRQYSKRGNKDRAEKISVKLEKNLSKPALSAKDFFGRMEFIDSLDFYYSSFDKRNLRYRHLIRSLRQLEYYFILQSSIFKKELITNSFYSENKIDETLSFRILNEINFEKLIEIIEKEDPENSVFLSIYYLIAKTLNNTFDDENYNKLRNLIIRNLKNIDFQSVKYLLLNLQLICTRRLNEGRKEYEKELYEISKILIDGKYYEKDENWFRASHFRTIVKMGISMNDIEYIEQFIHDYSRKLEPNLRIPHKNFAFANICFAKKMYSEALNYLNKTNLENTLYKIDLKRLTAKIYFETDSTENLLSFLDAFTHYLKNIRTIDQILINRNKKFIKYLKKIVKFKSSLSDSFELSNLQNSLLKENVSEKSWLLLKLSEINFKSYFQKGETGS